MKTTRSALHAALRMLDELKRYFDRIRIAFPTSQWRARRTTNALEPIN